MRITIESTTRIVEANGVKCRVWEGESQLGVKIQALIPLLAAKEGQDLKQLDDELVSHRAPSPDCCEAFPLRMIL